MKTRGKKPPKTAKRSVAKPVVFDWRVMMQEHAIVTRPDGRMLYVAFTFAGTKFAAVAVEGPAGAKAEQILADHGHHLIGRYQKHETARRECESFARRWLRSSASVEECACDEVGAR